MRKIALDLGSKTCGVALSDALNITAQGKENFRFEERDWETLVNHLEKKYFSKVDKIILGYPLLLSGTRSKTTFMVEEFKEYLESRTSIEIIYVDETYTTKRAHEIMLEANLSRKKRKQHKDKLAAVLILQDYLERI